MDRLLLNPTTEKDVNRFLAKPAPFLIISGSPGAGKLSLAIHLGGELLKRPLAANHPAVLRVSLLGNKSEISIDQVRDVIGKLKLSTPGTNDLRRLVLIEDGHYLSEEAQNALLKTLEEPPADTQIIMTVDAGGSILPTISSRAQTLEVRQVGLQDSLKYYSDKYEESEIKKAWLLSDGLVGLMDALLTRSDEHELKTAVEEAKKFITSSKYQRLVRANDFTKSRRQLELLIVGLQKIIKTAQRQSILNARSGNQAKMTSARKNLDQLSEDLRANVSPKTLYLNLCLNLGI